MENKKILDQAGMVIHINGKDVSTRFRDVDNFP